MYHLVAGLLYTTQEIQEALAVLPKSAHPSIDNAFGFYTKEPSKLR